MPKRSIELRIIALAAISLAVTGYLFSHTDAITAIIGSFAVAYSNLVHYRWSAEEQNAIFFSLVWGIILAIGWQLVRSENVVFVSVIIYTFVVDAIVDYMWPMPNTESS